MLDSDAELDEEQAWAKRLGVSIHTVFIGDGEYPPILDTLAMNTGGARFQAVPEYETGVVGAIPASSAFRHLLSGL